MMEWLTRQREVMIDRVVTWANINSGTANQPGVERMAGAVAPLLHELADTVKRVALPMVPIYRDDGSVTELELADAIVARRRPDAPVQALLVIHLDTVFGPDHKFQTTTWLDGDTLNGPGVVDAKGGLAVMLGALQAFERHSNSDRLGWTVLLNPDEEIGSAGSVELLQSHAREAHVGLVYEPCLPNGAMIRSRKGSWNYAVTVRGRSVHAGRDFEAGRNAAAALARVAARLDRLNEELEPDVTLNIGKIAGGSAVNIVPDRAMALLNLRVIEHDDYAAALNQINRIISEESQRDGIEITLHTTSACPPKPCDESTAVLVEQITACGRSIGLDPGWQASGGVCDGNKLAAIGLPTVDTLGPCGGSLHSVEEYLLVDSLVARSAVTYELLAGYAEGRFSPPSRYPESSTNMTAFDA